MSVGGGAIVVRALEDEGVPLTFGIPGTHNIELYDALAESERVRPILVTDEQSASFMADAVWRASGQLGCANVVPGAGLTHAMSGIAEAFMDTIPMLVLGCGIRRDTGMGFQLHDVDQLAMVAPVTKATFRPETGEDLYGTIRRACHIARSGVPGPVMVEVPANLYLYTHDVDLDRERSAFRFTAESPEADEALLERAVALLDGAERPLLYVGLGAAGADLLALAERLESPVASTIQGKGVFPESHPLFLWPGFGRAAPDFARSIAAECDAVLAIGCRFGEVGTGSYGLELPGPLVHVDIDAAALGRNYPAELTVHSDAAAFVEALIERARPRGADRALRERIAEGRERVRAGWRTEPSAEAVTPAMLLRRLQNRLGPRTIYTTDSGNGTFLAMEMLELDLPGRFLAPVDYSCMGYSVPAAIGAKLARPDCPVAALAGDGAFLMTGLELLTAATVPAPVAVFVLRDRELAQIAQFQQTALNRKTASRLPDYDLASICEGVGVECLRLESDTGIAQVLDRVVEITAAGRPVAVDVNIDYSEPTYFTRGVVRTNLARFPWRDRLRFITRAVGRKVFGG